MAGSVLIVGESGTGKSTSGRNLDPNETVWINIANKPIPFKGWKKLYPILNKENTNGRQSIANKPKSIIAVMKHVSVNMPEIKNIIVDDWQYASSFEYFDRASEKGYDKFTEIAQGIAAMARTPMELREDLTVFFLTHPDESQDHKGIRKTKAKTLGKMIDNTLTLEGLFSIVLYTNVKKDIEGNIEYVFETKNNGNNTCKAPYGMFDTDEIPNDLQLVKEAMQKYEQ